MQSLNIEYIFLKIYQLITGGLSFGDGGGFLKTIDSILTFILSIVAIVAITFILYILVRKSEMREKKAVFVNLTHDSDWRLAIIEADNILDEMVTRIGYKGDNLGEKLKSVEPSDFNTLQEAWEAHKVRNKIAHEGLNFRMDHREAKRVVAQFEKVFKEFEFI